MPSPINTRSPRIFDQLREILASRVMVIDGAMGTSLQVGVVRDQSNVDSHLNVPHWCISFTQGYKLKEEDFRGKAAETL